MPPDVDIINLPTFLLLKTTPSLISPIEISFNFTKPSGIPLPLFILKVISQFFFCLNVKKNDLFL